MGSESAIGCLVFPSRSLFLFPRSLPCSKQLFKSMKNGSHTIGLHTPRRSPRHPHHPRKPPQVAARADPAAPPVYPLFQNTIFQLYFSQFAVIFAARSHYKYSWKAALSTANFGKQKKWLREKKPSSLSQAWCPCPSVALTGTKFDPQTAEK